MYVHALSTITVLKSKPGNLAFAMLDLMQTMYLGIDLSLHLQTAARRIVSIDRLRCAKMENSLAQSSDEENAQQRGPMYISAS